MNNESDPVSQGLLSLGLNDSLQDSFVQPGLTRPMLHVKILAKHNLHAEYHLNHKLAIPST